MTYAEIIRLWGQYEDSLDDDHRCPTEEFVGCEVCEAAMEAKAMLNNRMSEVINLLDRYHKALGDLVQNVIQETELPRPSPLQDALRKALALDKDKS